MASAPFLKPRYDAGGFASLPERIIGLLTSGQYTSLVLFLIDGFGWRFFERFQDGPFLKTICRRSGVNVEKLTAQFPSTTAAHLTTLHTGQPVGEHGLFEWNIYEPALEAVITPLLFSFAGTNERDTLKTVGFEPHRLYPSDSIYPGLGRRGIAASLFQSRNYTPSTYSQALYQGAEARGFKTPAEALINLAEALNRSTSPQYFVFYYDCIDSLSHDYGPSAPQTEAEILNFLLTLEHIFLPALRPAGRSLCLLTADHGQVEVDPATTIYLNADPRFAGLEQFLRTDRAGRPIVPIGACRDFFLPIRAGLLDEAHRFLADRLEGQAEVRSVEAMAAEGWFGPRVSERFWARTGDLVILPYRGESVWWYEKDRFVQKYYGHHGGLTPQEMEIPLVGWEM
ncbi:MAG: nucleotide pyrophosphatase/phosphodiesterase family protein [Anaerolineales bacterium]